MTMEERPVVFISQPMSGLDISEIKEVRDRIMKKLENDFGRALYIIDNLQEDKDPETTTHLMYLGEDVRLLDNADVVYFAKGWEKSRGCNIEFQVAREYGIRMIFEEDTI